MRRLILADIHANFDAIEAFDESRDRLLVLGDLVDYRVAIPQILCKTASLELSRCGLKSA